MADPGFPIGGGDVDLVEGGMDSRGSYVSKILCRNERIWTLGGGACIGHAPRSANGCDNFAVADPGVPLGGIDLVGRGGVDSQGSYISKIIYVEMKESGPLGGGVPTRSANASLNLALNNQRIDF